MTDIHRRASDVLSKHRLGFSGLVVEDNRNLERDFHNGAAETTHRVDATITAANGSDTVAWTLGGRADLDDVDFAYSTSSAATTPTLAAAEIVDAFNSDAANTQFAWASQDGAIVKLLAPAGGTAFGFTVTSPVGTGGLTLSVATGEAAADPSAAPFGSVIFASWASRNESYLDVEADWGRGSARVGELHGQVLDSASPVITTITVAANEDAKAGRAVVKVGKRAPFVVDFVTSTTATLSAVNLAAAIDASPDVAATSSGAVVTVTSSRPGESVSIQVYKTVTTTTTFTQADASDSPITQPLLLGIVAYKPTLYDTRTLGEAATGIPAGEEGIALEEGFFLAKLNAVIAAPQALFAGTAGSEKGKLYTSGSSTRVAWDRCIALAPCRDGFTLCRLLPLAA